MLFANATLSDGRQHHIEVQGGRITALLPAWDPQMAWSFHKYWDSNTTAAIQPYLDLRTTSHRPVWNGETGEDNKTGWSGAMIALLETNKIGWNEWTYKKSGGQTTNPYTIADPPNWTAMATYLAKGGTPPTDATTTMLTLAANAATADRATPRETAYYQPTCEGQSPSAPV